MKLLLVIDTLESGGAQRLLSNIAYGLCKSYDTHIFLYNYTGNIFQNTRKDIKYHFNKKTRLKGLKINTIFALRKEMKDADIIISFMPSSNIYCSITRALFCWSNILICEEVSITNILESKFKRIITNFSYLNCNHIVCNSHTQSNYLKSIWFLTSKVSTIFNGCHEIPFKPRENKPIKSKSLLVVGRVAYPKNGLRLLKALQLFYEKHDFLPIVKWAGRIDNSRSKNNKTLDSMFDYLQSHIFLKKNFHFLGEVKDINTLLKEANGLISCSLFEGLPYAICEAMHNGCPVLASNISDNPLIIGEKCEKGILCDPLSVESIAKGLEKLIFMSDAEISIMTKNARKFAEENFSNHQMTNSYLNLIKNLQKM